MKLAIFLSSLATAMAQCGTGFKASGSDTVHPAAVAWVAPYQKLCPNAKPITIATGGSSAGAKDVCGGTSDVGMMSRQFKSTEATGGTNGAYTCVSGGKTVTQVAVAADGIIFVAKTGGNAAKCIAALTGGGLAVDQLATIFSNATASVKMNQLNAKCAAVEVLITGPDSSSGTQSFFIETVFKSGQGFRSTYVGSPDFNKVVTTVLSSGDYIGFVPLSFYLKNSAKLVAAKIKNSKGSFIVPSAATIGAGTYNPFSRLVYMNVLSTSLANVKDYITYGLSAAGGKLVVSAGLVVLPAATVTIMLKRLG